MLDTLWQFLQSVRDGGPHAVANQLSQGWVPPPKQTERTRKVLLVHAHPLPGSFSTALASASARLGGPRVALNLYSMKFDPRLSADERRATSGPQPKIQNCRPTRRCLEMFENT